MNKGHSRAKTLTRNTDRLHKNMNNLAGLGSVLTVLCMLGPVFSEPCPSKCTCLKNNDVYCNGTGITAIPKGLPFSTRLLDLSNNQIQYVSATALLGIHNLSSLDLSGNRLRSESIESGAFDRPELTRVDFSFNQFDTIPQEVPKTMTIFFLMRNNLTIIMADSFRNYSSVIQMDLSNNNIEIIEKHAFYPLVRLNTLDISFNKIQSTGLLFEKNEKLSTLNFKFNCIDLLVPGLPSSLENLNFVGNNLKSIGAYAFNNTPNLKTLAFPLNKISVIEDYAFQGLGHLETLDLTENNITSGITNNTFNGLFSLKSLDLGVNNIPFIHPGAFLCLSQVTSLGLGNNGLSTLQTEVFDTNYMPHLSELFIFFNPWHCDCHLRWLRQKVDNAPYIIQGIHDIKCDGPSALAGKSWDVLQPSDFVCG